MDIDVRHSGSLERTLLTPILLAEGLKLTINLAGEAYKFIAKTVASVKKAISWVLAKAKVGIEKIIEFIGFPFHWQDILQTSDNLVMLFNAGLDFG